MCAIPRWSCEFLGQRVSWASESSSDAMQLYRRLMFGVVYDSLCLYTPRLMFKLPWWKDTILFAQDPPAYSTWYATDSHINPQYTAIVVHSRYSNYFSDILSFIASLIVSCFLGTLIRMQRPNMTNTGQNSDFHMITDGRSSPKWPSTVKACTVKTSDWTLQSYRKSILLAPWCSQKVDIFNHLHLVFGAPKDPPHSINLPGIIPSTY